MEDDIDTLLVARDFIGERPDDIKAVVLLRLIGYGYKEIAYLLGISKSKGSAMFASFTDSLKQELSI